MEFKDYYVILGVKPDADSSQIKTAYRKLARQYHPDMNSDAGAEDKFKEVAEAHEVLKNKTRRAEFDELRRYGRQSKQGFSPPPGWRSSSNASEQHNPQFDGEFSDFFNSMFGARNRNFNNKKSEFNQPMRGQDAEIEISVSLEESIAEHTRTVAYRLPLNKGGQATHIDKRLNVKIPKGVIDGERIRLKGQGSPGAGNASAGDLYLQIRLKPHPLFDVEGCNLMLTLPISPWEAALGTKVEVPTLTGKISLTITPNAQSGNKLRIKGRGLQGKALAGDLFAIIKVVMPVTASIEAQEHWQTLAKIADFDPRAQWSHSK
jgi:curved DNA-binding protein